MKVALSVIVAGVSASDSANSIAKLIDTMTDCERKVTKEGEAAQAVYSKTARWCQDRAANLQYELKTAQSQADEGAAIVAKETSTQQSLTSQIEDLAADIASDEKDLVAATKVRGRENADFLAAEKDLVAVIDTLARAIAVIERNQAQGASMMQLKGVTSLTQAFKAMVQASTMNTADAQVLTAFAQSSSSEDDDELGGPAAAVYEHQGGGIVDLLEGLRDQANEQLDKSRAAEATAVFNYKKLKHSLEDATKYATEELADAKKGLAASQEAQATAQGDLDVTKKDLAEDHSALADLHSKCMTTSEDFETEAKSRQEEMRGLAMCKEAMKKIQLRGNSFLQLSLAESPSKLAVRTMRKLSQKHNDPVLTQMASRMASTVAMGSKTGEDVFAKIKAMLVDDIAKLQEEQAADATQKAYCDKELAESTEKVASNKAKIEKHTTKIEQKSSNSIKVKAEVKALQEELAKMTSEKLEMDNLRQQEKTDYDSNKADTAQSLSEIKMALKTLRDFYSNYEKEHSGFSSSDGTSNGVIAMLETVESEFATTLAQLTAVEEVAVRQYDEESKTFEVQKVVKDKAIKYKTKEHMGLDKYVADETTDRDGVQSEFDANSDALSKLQQMCTGKAETYEDRVARREEEMADLKETLDALESETEGEGAEAAPAEAEAAPAEAAPAEAAPAEAAPAEAAPAEEASLVQRSSKRFRGGVLSA